MAIGEAHQINLLTLRDAFASERVGLLRCRNGATGELEVLLCAFNKIEDKIEMIPFAVMIEGSPYTRYISPDEEQDYNTLKKENEMKWIKEAPSGLLIVERTALQERLTEQIKTGDGHWAISRAISNGIELISRELEERASAGKV